MNRAIFFDRDGIINIPEIRENRSFAPTTKERFIPLPGLSILMDLIKSNGYYIFVITNQPDIENGLVTKGLVDEFHSFLNDQYPQIDEILVCPHRKESNCKCRKPKPYFLDHCREKYNLNFKESWVIGDRWSDIVLGKNQDCNTGLVYYGYHERYESPTIESNSVLDIIEKITGQKLENRFHRYELWLNYLAKNSEIVPGFDCNFYPIPGFSEKHKKLKFCKTYDIDKFLWTFDDKETCLLDFKGAFIESNEYLNSEILENKISSNFNMLKFGQLTDYLAKKFVLLANPPNQK